MSNNQLIEIKGNLSPVGWEAPANLTDDEWEQVGQTINRTDKMMGWIIGDWLNAYPGEWGNMYEEAMRLTGYGRSRLEDLKSISSGVKFSLRKENLTISHHTFVAKFRNDPAKQNHWLERAEKEGWSARNLAEAIKEDEKLPCPTCGERFDEQFWHCPICDGHWFPGQKCKNCAKKKEAVKPEPVKELTHEQKEALFDQWESIAKSAPVLRQPDLLNTPEAETDFIEPKRNETEDKTQIIPTEREIYEAAIAAMKEGGQRFCDEAIKKWQSDYYGDIPDKAVHIRRWQMAKREIPEIIKSIGQK